MEHTTRCFVKPSADADRQYQPRSMLLQWHVTERCNLRCSHCYQEDVPTDEMPFDELLDILDQFRQLLQNDVDLPLCRKLSFKNLNRLRQLVDLLA